MPTLRELGRTGLQVHPLCLGGNVFGWSADEAASFAVLDAYAEGGGNFVDTADSYSRWVPGNEGGESEAIIGRWLRARGNRDQVIVATKVGSDMGQGRKDVSAGYVRTAVEASLRRLQVERIDLLYVHWDVPETPLAETLGALDELVRAGKVGAIGASNISAGRLAEALVTSDRDGLARYGAVQPPYNLVERDGYEGALEELCRREHLGVAPYYGLASGFLTGKYRRGGPAPDSVRAGGVASRYADRRSWAVLDAVLAVAERQDATPAQVSLAWLLARPSIASPIASATSPEQVRELLGATAVQLTPEDVAELDRAGAVR
jgi:aryl-alcohol dehydrogenase-like predicted oxidoreductase